LLIEYLTDLYLGDFQSRGPPFPGGFAGLVESYGCNGLPVLTWEAHFGYGCNLTRGM
jgi:hypothetical protein